MAEQHLDPIYREGHEAGDIAVVGAGQMHQGVQATADRSPPKGHVVRAIQGAPTGLLVQLIGGAVAQARRSVMGNIRVLVLVLVLVLVPLSLSPSSHLGCLGEVN